MRSSRNLDRRTFLKLGAAGTAVAAINPSMGLASVRATRTLSSPPTLVDMTADRLTYRLRDLFNCLGSFDSGARLEGVRYQGGLYTITKDGAQREKA